MYNYMTIYTIITNYVRYNYMSVYLYSTKPFPDNSLCLNV